MHGLSPEIIAHLIGRRLYNPSMSARECRPDALIMGAPNAGTSALHAALTQHPQIYTSPVKEPKYYMCWDAPPPAYRGPGDAHSNREVFGDSAIGAAALARPS